MFGLFQPKRPLDLYEKAWIEWRWRWLGEQLGWQTMLDAPVYSLGDIPGSDQRQLSERDVQSMFRFIAESMDIDLSRIRLIIEPEHRMRDAVFGYGVYLSNNTIREAHWSDERINELIDFSMAGSAAPDSGEIHRIDD